MKRATLKLTGPRVKALDVLRRAYPLAVRESNVTSYGPPPLIYWQTARWLIGEKLVARERGTEGACNVVLTRTGLDVAHKACSPPDPRRPR